MVDLEKAHTGLTEIHIVDSMSERKEMLSDISDACIALPGGTGTLDELFEQIVLQQTGFACKPSGLLNVCGYYDHLIRFMNHAINEGYISQPLPDILTIADQPGQLLDALKQRLR